MTNDGFEYIGQSKDVGGRVKRHQKDPYKQKHMETGFRVEILASFNTRDEATLEEKKLVTREYILRPDTLNRFVGGQGGFEHIDRKHHIKSGKTKIENGNSRSKKVIAHLEKLNEMQRGVARPNHSKVMKAKECSGVGHLNTKESIDKMRATKCTPESRKKSADAARGRRFYNDGTRSYRLREDDPKIKDLNLVPGHHKHLR